MASRAWTAVGFGLGALVGIGLGGVSAVAQEPPPEAPPVVASSLKCRTFEVADLGKDRDVATDDKSTEIGQWVTARESEGWRVASVDLEIGQKATGYPVGFQQVCLEKAR